MHGSLTSLHINIDIKYNIDQVKVGKVTSILACLLQIYLFAVNQNLVRTKVHDDHENLNMHVSLSSLVACVNKPIVQLLISWFFVVNHQKHMRNNNRTNAIDFLDHLQ